MLNDGAKIRFLIVMEGRSGSELLISLLRGHPQVRLDGEILRDEKNHEWLLASRENELEAQKAYGFKCRLSYLHQIPNPDAVFKSFIDDGWHIVNLKRKNLLRQAMSFQIGSQLKELVGEWGLTKEAKNRLSQGLKVQIDCEQLLNLAKWLRKLEAWREQLVGNVPQLPVIYEMDLLPSEMHQSTANNVFSYVGLNPMKVSTHLLRITSDDLSKTVTNIDDVLHSIRGTWLEQYVDW